MIINHKNKHFAWRGVHLFLIVTVCNLMGLMGATVNENSPQALQTAINAGGEIKFGFSGTINLSYPLIVANDVIIDGVGQTITLDGGYTETTTNQTGTRLFIINTGATLTLNNLTLTKGVSTNGGAIYVKNGATLVVSNCLFSDNNVIGANGANGANGNNTISVGGGGGNGVSGGNALGGAIYNEGDITLITCLFSDNITSGGNGGNGGNGGDGDFTGGNGGSGGNGGLARGGALFSVNKAAITNCTFYNNQATGGSGGNGGTNGVGGASNGRPGQGGYGAEASGAAIYNSGYLSMYGCTIYNNFCQGGNSMQAGTGESSNGNNGYSGGSSLGGGIVNTSTNVLINCTFYANETYGGKGGDGGNSVDMIAGNGGNGGNAIGGSYFNTGYSYITNCTFSSGNVVGGTNGVAGQGNFAGSPGNIGLSAGGNIANQGSLIIQNSIITAAIAGGNFYGSITDAGHNISSDSTGLYQSSSFKKTNPQIIDLADNGGLTYTMALLADSPAIDNGYTILSLTNDQCGTVRPYGDAVDIGAYEYPATRIRGRITDGSNGIPSIKVVAGTRYTFTDTLGYYVISNMATGSYVVAPQDDRYSFSPSSQTVNARYTSVTNINYVGSRLYKLGGRIVENGVGLPNVVITANSFSANTDINGYYIFTNLPSGNYTATPGLNGYKFYPQSTNVILQSDITNVNFSAAATIFTITGKIIEGSNGVSGVMITMGNLTNYSDSSGVFSFTNLSSGNYLIVPSKSGYNFNPPVISVSLNSNTNLTFTASGIYNISGKITKGGLPIQGIKVYAGIYSATTDNSGDFTILNVSPKTYNVTPVLSGYTFDPPYYSIDVSRDYYGLEYIVLNSFSVIGNVYNINPITLATNGVVSNLTINATNFYVSITGQTNQTIITTITDTNGTYILTNIIEGSIFIKPETNRYLFYPPITNVFLTSNTNQINFLASELFKVSGRIKFEDGGLSGVKVAAGGLTTTTLNDGYFEFTNLEATNIVIKPELDGYRFVPSQIALTPNDSSTNINFTAYGSLSISGVVTKDGTGLSGVYVAINQYLVQTLNDGSYLLDGLVPGNYQINPYLSDYIFNPQSISLTLLDTNAIVNFTAIPIYNVSGRVTDGIKGILGATVSSGTTSTLTDVNGYFTLIGIPKGTNKITVALTGYLFSPLDVYVDSDMYGINIVATRLHNISGRILEGARGVSGVLVLAGGVSTFSTSAGYYTLTNVPEGNVIIIPERTGYRFVPSNIVLNLTADATNMNFLAYGILSISGHITDGTNGINGIRINAYGIETVTDATGYYIVSNLPPRSITVMPIDDGYLFIPGSTNITLTGENAVNVNFLALKFSTISGQVLKSGNPEPDVKIQSSDGQEVLTDTNGQFVITGILPGSYIITASKIGHQFKPQGYIVSLPSDITNLNFTAYPLLMSAMITNNILVISVNAKPSCDYMIEATDSLTTAIWNDIAPFQTDTNGTIQLIIPTIDKTKPRFYRFRSL